MNSNTRTKSYGRLLWLTAKKLAALSSAYSLTLPGSLGKEFRRKQKPACRILRFERIGDPGLVDAYGSRRFALDRFRATLEVLKREVAVVPLRELVRNKVGGLEIDRPQVALTFDGGYEEHYRFVFPILKELGLPAAFFLPTDFIGSEDLFWFQKIELSLRALAAAGLLPSEFRTLESAFLEIWQNTDSPQTLDELRIELLIEYLWLAEESRKALFLDELSEYTAHIPRPGIGRQFMSWDEVREIAAAGHTIGSLGHRGIPLPHLSMEGIGFEIKKSFELLKELGVEYTAIVGSLRGASTVEQRKLLRSSGLEIVLDAGIESLGSEDECWVLGRVALNDTVAPSVGLALQAMLGRAQKKEVLSGERR